MTTDLQRMHQNEWLSALRMVDELGRGVAAIVSEPRCALGVGVRIAAPDLTCPNEAMYLVGGWLGISWKMVDAIWSRNDGVCSEPQMSAVELADFFKEQRDAHDGDLSKWRPA